MKGPIPETAVCTTAAKTTELSACRRTDCVMLAKHEFYTMSSHDPLVWAALPRCSMEARLLKGWGRLLPSAEVGQRPGCIAEHGQLGVVLELLQEGRQGTALEHQISALRRVACNVPQSPNSLHSVHAKLLHAT